MTKYIRVRPDDGRFFYYSTNDFEVGHLIACGGHGSRKSLSKREWTHSFNFKRNLIKYGYVTINREEVGLPINTKLDKLSLGRKLAKLY